MSQPPQPPGPPPPGGFGAPQEPPQGGFGAPQQPPAAPPQPPAQPPTPPPGHPPADRPGGHTPPPPAAPAPGPYTPPPAWHSGANPAATPPPVSANPYAQTQPQPAVYPPPGPIPGYPQPGPPSGPPGGGRGMKRKAVVIGAAAAVVLAAGGTVWAVLAGGGDDKPQSRHSSGPTGKPDDKPTTKPSGTPSPTTLPPEDPNTSRQPGEAAVLFQTPAPEVPRSGTDIPGFWVLKDHVVKTVQDKVVAYADDGAEKWTVPLPKAICSAPRTHTDGKVVIAYEGKKKDECSRIALIDINKGTKLWDHAAPEAGAFGGSYTAMGMAQSGDLVGLSWFGGSGMVRVSDGKEVSAGELSPACSVKGFAGGKALLRTYTCTDGTAKLQKIDPANGKIKWTHAVRKGFEVNKIYSVSPVVVYIANEKKKEGGVLSIKEGGKEGAVLATGKTVYQPRCGMDIFNSNIGGCQGVAASADTFYLPTKMDDKSEDGLTTEIHAFDLKSGKKKWATRVDGRLLYPLRTEGRNLIAYRAPSYDQAGAVVSIGAKGGKPKTVLQNPEATMDAENGFYSAQYVYENGNFYIASDRLTGTGDDEMMLMAFGP